MTVATPPRWAGPAAGVAAVLVGLGASELVAAWLAPTAGPADVVGAAIIDLVPGWVKDAVVAAFGLGDKTFLLVCVIVVTLALSALAGTLEARRPWTGRAIMIAGGLLGAVAAATRGAASTLAVVPSLVAGFGAALVLLFLLNRFEGRSPATAALSAVERRAAASTETDADTPSSPARRAFLGWSAAAAVVGVVAAYSGQLLTAAATAASKARAALQLPAPAKTAPAIPASASLDIRGITPIVTANGDFYRIDTALQVPELNPADWKLEVTGMVDHPFTLSWAELTALPLEESVTTLACVSNEVGGDLISNARWLGYPIRLLLQRAGVQSGADMVFSSSHDGWTASTPLEAVTDPNREAIIAIGMNGQPLPFEHGFPARMVVPGLYGYVSATKWVVKLEVTRFADHVSYWTERGWSQKGPIKQSSRIDVPQPGVRVKAGDVAVAGVAWHQHTGIKAVEVQVDDGPWDQAKLADAINIDTWRQWSYRWPATSGKHTLRVRAIDQAGQVQTSAVADVVPNGSTGLHEIEVNVS